MNVTFRSRVQSQLIHERQVNRRLNAPTAFVSKTCQSQADNPCPLDSRIGLRRVLNTSPNWGQRRCRSLHSDYLARAYSTRRAPQSVRFRGPITTSQTGDCQTVGRTGGRTASVVTEEKHILEPGTVHEDLGQFIYVRFQGRRTTELERRQRGLWTDEVANKFPVSVIALLCHYHVVERSTGFDPPTESRISPYMHRPIADWSSDYGKVDRSPSCRGAVPYRSHNKRCRFQSRMLNCSHPIGAEYFACFTHHFVNKTLIPEYDMITNFVYGRKLTVPTLKLLHFRGRKCGRLSCSQPDDVIGIKTRLCREREREKPVPLCLRAYTDCKRVMLMFFF